METSTLNDRILSLINELSLTPAAFADEIGVQRSGIAHIAKGRNKPSLDMVQKIMSRYPDVNVLWLLKGDGNMFSTTPNVISLQQRSTIPSTPIIDNSLKNTLFETSEPSPTPPTVAVKEKTAEPIITTPPTPAKSYSHTDFEEEIVDESSLKENKTITPLSLSTADIFQSPHKDKKINKIVVFYNDNSYQEFLP